MAALSFAEAVSGYLVAYSGGTLRTNRSAVDAWLAWCRENMIDAGSARRVHIEAWSTWMGRAGLAPSTRASRLSVVCGLYTYAHEEGAIPDDPGERVRRPRQYRSSDGTWLTADQAARAVVEARCMRPAHGAAVLLMLLNGLRVSEPIGLDVEDVVGDEVRVMRKGRYAQRIRVSHVTAEALGRAVGRRISGPALAVGGRRLRAKELRDAVAGLGEAVGANGRITPHSLRRTFCTLARDAGVPDRDIMASGGWTTRAMVDYYDMSRASVERNATDAVTEYLAAIAERA